MAWSDPAFLSVAAISATAIRTGALTTLSLGWFFLSMLGPRTTTLDTQAFSEAFGAVTPLPGHREQLCYRDARQRFEGMVAGSWGRRALRPR